MARPDLSLPNKPAILRVESVESTALLAGPDQLFSIASFEGDRSRPEVAIRAALRIVLGAVGGKSITEPCLVSPDHFSCIKFESNDGIGEFRLRIRVLVAGSKIQAIRIGMYRNRRPDCRARRAQYSSVFLVFSLIARRFRYSVEAPKETAGFSVERRDATSE